MEGESAEGVFSHVVSFVCACVKTLSTRNECCVWGELFNYYRKAQLKRHTTTLVCVCGWVCTCVSIQVAWDCFKVHLAQCVWLFIYLFIFNIFIVVGYRKPIWVL